MNPKTEEMLHARIEQLEQEAEKLRDDLKRAQALADAEDWGWMVEDVPIERPSLPVPRLELEWVRRGPHSMVVVYRLVSRHLLGHLCSRPMGRTRVDGHNLPWPPMRDDGHFDLPYREGPHIQHDRAHLGLPAFCICEDRVEELNGDGYEYQVDQGKKHRVDRS